MWPKLRDGSKRPCSPIRWRWRRRWSMRSRPCQLARGRGAPEYSPDKEYRDGVLLERNVGDQSHARLQALLALYRGKRILQP